MATGNSYGVASAIVTLAQTVQVAGQAAYANLVAGEYKDITDLVPCFECYGDEDMTERASITMGAGLGQNDVADEQRFWLVSTVAMTDATAGWQSLWAIRDALTAVLHGSMSLNLAGVTFSALEGGGKYEPVFRNGDWWLMHRIPLRVRYEFSVTQTT